MLIRLDTVWIKFQKVKVTGQSSREREENVAKSGQCEGFS